MSSVTSFAPGRCGARRASRSASSSRRSRTSSKLDSGDSPSTTSTCRRSGRSGRSRSSIAGKSKPRKRPRHDNQPGAGEAQHEGKLALAEDRHQRVDHRSDARAARIEHEVVPPARELHSDDVAGADTEPPEPGPRREGRAAPGRHRKVGCARRSRSCGPPPRSRPAARARPGPGGRRSARRPRAPPSVSRSRRRPGKIGSNATSRLPVSRGRGGGGRARPTCPRRAGR